MPEAVHRESALIHPAVAVRPPTAAPAASAHVVAARIDAARAVVTHILNGGLA